MNQPVQPEGPWESLLHWADAVVVFVGLLIGVVVVVRWLIRGAGDPLAPAREPAAADGPLPADAPDACPPVGQRLVLEGMLLPVVAWIGAALMFTSLVQAAVSAEHMQAGLIIAGNLAHVCGAAACLVVAAFTFDGGLRRFLLGTGHMRRDIAWALVSLMVALGVCPLLLHATLWVISVYAPQYHLFDHEVIEALRGGEAPLVALWIGTAIIAPVAEECFFRGILQTGIGNMVRSRWLTVVLSGLVFGAVHAGAGETPQPHVVPALAFLGVMLGALYMRTGSLVGPILFHALFNAKTLLWETLLYVR